MKKISLLLLIIPIMFASPVSAQPYISLSPQAVWLGDSISITCFAPNGTNATLYAEITSPISATLSGFVPVNETCSEYSYTPPISGKYTIYCTNGSSSSNEANFTVANLTLDAQSFLQTLYSSDDIKLTASLYMETDTTETITSNADFSVFIDQEQAELKGVPYFYNNNWIIETQPLSFPEGNHTLTLSATYNGKTVSLSRQITILPDLDFHIISLSQSSVTEESNITADISLLYRGTPVLQQSQITASLENQNIPVYKTPTGLILTLPDKDPGTYTLKLTALYNGIESVQTVTINYLIPVTGTLKDSDGKPVSGTLKFENTDGSYEIKIKNGQYEGTIPQGTYDVTFSTKNIEVVFSGVDASSDMEDIISFDLFPDSYGPAGLKTISGFALEFFPGFSGATIKASYDASRAEDESNLNVFRCPAWNIDSRKCYSEWTAVSAEINPSKNTAEFSLSSLSGFVIGERKALELQASIDKSKYNPEEEIRLTGVVKSGNRPVPDAVVSYTGMNISGETKTNSNGVFSANIKVPEKEGTYTLFISSSKGLYIEASATEEFSVEAKKDLSLVLPLTAEALVNSSSSFDITLINTGQAPLHDVVLTISGMPNEWFSFEPKSWDTIDPGEEKIAHLIVSPASYEKRSYIIEARAVSNEISKTDSFILNIHSMQNTTQSKPLKQSENVSNSYFEPFTSYVTANSETLVNSGSLIASAIIIFYILWKLWGKREPSSYHTATPAPAGRHTRSPISGVSAIQEASGITQIVKREVLRDARPTKKHRKRKTKPAARRKKKTSRKTPKKGKKRRKA